MSQNILNFFSNLDKDFYLYVQGHINNGGACLGLQKFYIFITDLGDPKMMILISMVVILTLWLLKRNISALQFALTIIIAASTVVGLKHLISRERPIGIITEDGYSFPSGHALIAAVFFPLIIYTFKYYINNIWLRRLFIVICLGLIFLIGWTRLYLGVHYLSDILGGYLIGGLISSISILLMEAYKRKTSSVIEE